MARKKYYIPARDADFDAFFKNICQYVSQKTSGSNPEWKHIPQEAITALNTAYSTWYTAYSKVKGGPHTKAETAAKNAARTASQKVLAEFVNQYLRFPPVTNEDRINMGIPNKPTTFSPVHQPAAPPEFIILIRGIRQIIVDFKEQGAAGKARPYGCNGAVIYWGVLDAPPPRPEDLPKSELAGDTPHTIRFDETERGKRVYIALCWEIEGGHKGPFSEIVSAIIP
jgi:hypothetical protein